MGCNRAKAKGKRRRSCRKVWATIYLVITSPGLRLAVGALAISTSAAFVLALLVPPLISCFQFVGSIVDESLRRLSDPRIVQTYQELQPLRSIGDPDCDEVLEVLDPQPDDDILQMLLDRADAAIASGSNKSGDKVLVDFVKRYSSVPEWVDWYGIDAMYTDI